MPESGSWLTAPGRPPPSEPLLPSVVTCWAMPPTALSTAPSSWAPSAENSLPSAPITCPIWPAAEDAVAAAAGTFSWLRWAAIRGEFREQLERRLREELDRVYLELPGELAAKLVEERKQVDKLIADTKEVAAWLAERQQAARVAELYGT